MKPEIYRCGDRAITIEFGREICPAVNRAVLALERSLNAVQVNGILETVPSYASLLVCYNPQQISFDALCKTVYGKLESTAGTESGDCRVWEIPCCYGMHFGMDMDAVCRNSGLSAAEVTALHSGVEYRIYMLGFMPGFVYLGGLNPQLKTPRLKVPRTQIPRGSVGIGGMQTGIYPLPSPGGWNLIGCTPVELYNPKLPEPVIFSAGDYIRFCPVSADEFYTLRRDAMRGCYTPYSFLRRVQL